MPYDIRLETVIGILKKFEEGVAVELEGSYLDNFSKFDDALPNFNHFSLAKLIRNGAVVVTTNYDSCIQKAYSKLFQAEMTQRKISERIYCYEGDEGGKLYCIHGIAKEPNSLGISLETINNTLTGEFKECIEAKYKSDSLFLFLGYGCADDFDVNCMFKEIEDSGKSSTGLCVVYPSEKGNQGPTVKQIEMINHFRKSLYVIDTANAFFEKQYGFKYDDIYCKYQPENDWWSRDFWTYPENTLKELNMYLDYNLGIRRQKYTRVFFKNCNTTIGKVAADFYASHFLRTYKIKEVIRILISKELMKKDKDIVLPEEVTDNIIESEKIGWDFVAPINHKIKALFLIFCFNRNLADRSAVESLYRSVSEVLENKPLSAYGELRAKYVLQLDLAMLKTMKNESWIEIKTLLQKVMESYEETREIEGIFNSIKIFMKIVKQLRKTGKIHISYKKYHELEKYTGRLLKVQKLYNRGA